MPIRFDWKCPDGHTSEGVTTYERRDDPRDCPVCGKEATRQFPKTHSPPSGVYSYAPNIGDPDVFEQRLDAARKARRGEGPGALPKILPRNYVPPGER